MDWLAQSDCFFTSNGWRLEPDQLDVCLVPCPLILKCLEELCMYSAHDYAYAEWHSIPQCTFLIRFADFLRFPEMFLCRI